MDLADGFWGWVVLGVVKTCSDGALDVRNMRSFLYFLDVHACFCTVTCRVNHVTCHSDGLGMKLLQEI